jgi:hypothetical protein
LHKLIELTIIFQWQNPYKNLCRLWGDCISPWLYHEYFSDEVILCRKFWSFCTLSWNFSHFMTQFCLTTNVALIVPTLNLDISLDHILFITENILSTGAVLPGRQRIISTVLQKSWKCRRSFISEKNLYPSIRYRKVFFIPCIQLPHDYKFCEGPLIEYTSFFVFLCVWWVPCSGCPVFLSIQMSSLVAPTWTSQCFLNCTSTCWHILS